ncbi:MAG: serine/threonine protein kinase [Acidobacteria bacterium]|nr:serine/threonine protein kinase [Acidobacteriota bacterium]
MGEVCRAEDTNLSRQVAINVLPDEFAHDAERLARFEREAQTASALNQPNIATIHGLEEANPEPSRRMTPTKSQSGKSADLGCAGSEVADYRKSQSGKSADLGCAGSEVADYRAEDWLMKKR